MGIMRILIALVLFIGSALMTVAQEMGQETRNGQVYKIHAFKQAILYTDCIKNIR